MKWPFTKQPNNTRQAQTTSIIVQGRPDYYQPFGQSIGYLPPPQDPVILHALRQAIPTLDSAVDMLVKLTGNVAVQWDSESVQAPWDAWVNSCKVAPLSTGMNGWLNGYQERMLMYGTAGSEIIVDARGKDVYGFQYISPQSLRLRQNDQNPLEVVVLQQQTAKPEPVVLDRERIALSAFRPRDDSPYGRSLFADCPFIGEMLLEIAHATKQNWNRVGAPSFVVTVEVPQGLDSSVDVGELMDGMLAKIKTAWANSMNSRKSQGNIKDFVGAGNIKVTTVGSDGQLLEMEVPWKAAMEQIVTVTHLPAWMLGFHWSTTERLSSEQAEALERVILDYQAELTPVATFAADWWARVRGYDAIPREITWPSLAIRDRVELARAELIEEQARATREKTATQLWRSGIYNQEQYAQDVLECEEVSIATPMEEPPAAATPQGFGGLALSAKAVRGESLCNCGCGHTHKADHAPASIGLGEQPSDQRVADAAAGFYNDAKAAVNELRGKVMNILQLPATERAAVRDIFSFSDEQNDALNRAIDAFVARMAGSDLSRNGFVAESTGDGIIQQWERFSHAIGVGRVTEITDANAAVSTSRNSPAVEALLGNAFDRLSDSGKLRLDDGTRSGIYDIIEQGVSLGSNPVDVARDMTDYFDGYASWQMERLARTEVAYAQNAGYINECQGEGVDTSTVDLNAMPVHPNCMCGYSIEQAEDGSWHMVYDVSEQACDECQLYAN